MPKQAPDPTTLKRESAGTYRTADGRFTVQEASGRWLVIDAEQQDELGLPRTRGPFDTLARARAALTEARSGPAPASSLRDRLDAANRSAKPSGRGPRTAARAVERGAKHRDKVPESPPIEIRRYRAGDGPALRALWQSIGLKSVGDDDESLDRMAERNPGFLLVAGEGDRLVGSALGAWDGRRGWIYHLGTADDRRRAGLGRRLVQEVERKLRQLGCPRVNVIVREANPEGAEFWEALGYAPAPSRLFGKDL